MTNPTALTPDDLAERLDALLQNPQQPVADPLLQAASRLINGRHPELSAAAFARIRQQLLEAAAQPPSFTTRLLQSPIVLIMMILIGIAAVILIGVLIFSALQNRVESIPTTLLPETLPPVTLTDIRVTTVNPVLATFTPLNTVTPTVSVTPTAAFTAAASATAVPLSQIALPSALPSATGTLLTPTITLTRPLPSATALPPTTFTTATLPPTTGVPALATATIENTAANTAFAHNDASATPTLTRTAAPLTTLIIEGTIEAINVNQLVIFGITILLNPNDPLLAGLRVGDEVRIEAVVVRSGGFIIISAVTVEATSVAIFVNEATGAIFRDDSDCSNPPPAWAPASGWRARCGSGAAPNNSGNPPSSSGDTPGNAGGMPEDDDD